MKKVLALLLFLASSSAFGQAIWAPVQDYWTRIDGGVVVAGGSGYLTIKDETTAQTARTILTFLGSAITCTDNAGNLATECTVTGGGGAVASDTIWDAAGDLAVGTGADTATVLPIGTVNTVLTSTGTTAAWSYPEPAGEDVIYYHDDFVCGEGSATGVVASCLVWNVQQTTATWATNPNGTTTTPGIIRGTADAVGDVVGIGVTSAGSILLMDKYRFRARVKFPNLSDGTDTFVAVIGGTEAAGNTTTAPIVGVYFTYTNTATAPAGTPNWTIVVADAGTDTSADCGIAIVADTWQKLDIRYESGVGVHFYVDAVECTNSPINTDLPQAGGEEFGWMRNKLWKTVGTTARSFDFDYVTIGPTPFAR